MYDIIVIGAGPAGLTASIYARRANKSVLLLEKDAPGGQMVSSPKIENYPGFSEISGSELADKMLSQAFDLGVDMDIGEVVSITEYGNEKRVLLNNDAVYIGKSVIIAVGVEHRLLGLENEDRFIGNGISFCAVCDGAFYKDRDVIIVGGGNSALQEAIFLSDICSHVTVVQNMDRFTGESRLEHTLRTKENVDIIFNSTVKGIYNTQDFSGITIEDSEDGHEYELFADGMFLAIGLKPNLEIFTNVASVNESGYFISDEIGHTRTNGIFVAGDCKNKRTRQVVTATADGASAAIAACSYIDSLE